MFAAHKFNCIPLHSLLKETQQWIVGLGRSVDSKPIAERVIQGKPASVVQIIVQAVGYGATWKTITQISAIHS
jgi:hypothetical protein